MNGSYIFTAVAGVFAAFVSGASAFLMNGNEVVEQGPSRVLFAGDAFMTIGARASDEVLGLFNKAKEELTKPTHELFEAIESKSDVLFEHPGDASATAALVYSKLGGKAGYFGIVGDDRMATKFNDYMAGYNVEMMTVRRSNDITSQLFSLVGEDGTYNLYKVLGACDSISSSDVDASIMDNFDFFVVTTDMLRTASRTAFTAKLVDAAINRGKKIITVFTDVVFGDYDAEMLKAILHSSEYVFGSMEQYVAVYKFSSRDDAADAMHQKTSGEKPAHKAMLVNFGEEGFALFFDGKYLYVPAPEVEVERSDADDFFTGAMMYGMLNGRKMKDTIQYARAVLVDVCSEMGASLSDNFDAYLSEIPRI
ncbi:adenosine kinase [Babesia ovata]|uniref:Adenosine kinase n=1 Tax=Babesia ovata TaxID=189622 RepID=A0A2H6KDT1_9APIC|nr:adenosine kinase [Babesia ovata]GBE61134.1 adenosine kinase [Babesia ovata]